MKQQEKLEIDHLRETIAFSSGDVLTYYPEFICWFFFNLGKLCVSSSCLLQQCVQDSSLQRTACQNSDDICQIWFLTDM